MNQLEKMIWFCWVTKNNHTTVQAVQQSLEQQIRRFGTRRIGLIILDKSSVNHPQVQIESTLFEQVYYYEAAGIRALEQRHAWVWDTVQYNSNQDSVQRARLQLYCMALEHEADLRDAIIWQLDDDMCLGETRLDASQNIHFTQERDYCALIRAYHKRYPWVDAAIGYCSYVPPLPVFLYLQQQLATIGSLPKQHQHGDWQYHDLHGTTPPASFGKATPQQLRQLLCGAPLQPLCTPEECPLTAPPKPSYLRGGNFIAFNYHVLVALPHCGFHYNGWIARRSDMFHAWALQRKGYRICAIDLSLIHRRAFGRIDGHKLQTSYLEDAFGAVAFRFVQANEQAALARWNVHRTHVDTLLSRVLADDYINLGEVGRMMAEALAALQITLQQIDWVNLKMALEHFQHYFETNYLNLSLLSCTSSPS